jgi:hypothetical protein
MTSSIRRPACRSTRRRCPIRPQAIILKTLVDRYGVLPPELIETVLPAQARR